MNTIKTAVILAGGRGKIGRAFIVIYIVAYICNLL